MAMKLITTALIAGLVPAAAIAQSPPFLTNSTPSVSPFVQSPAVKWAETTGAGVSLDPMLLPPEPIIRGRIRGRVVGNPGFRKVSPASPAQGTKQAK